MLVMVSWEFYPKKKWMLLLHLVKCLKRDDAADLGWM
ncbi:MAG: hypothetical protein CM15mP49_26010 [Actinomycetota bacterium]|nr:MAG: hypothetical protein CM15mP49_26010 [Actinomycetota bacterium]